MMLTPLSANKLCVWWENLLIYPFLNMKMYSVHTLSIHLYIFLVSDLPPTCAATSASRLSCLVVTTTTLSTTI